MHFSMLTKCVEMDVKHGEWQRQSHQDLALIVFRGGEIDEKRKQEKYKVFCAFNEREGWNNIILGGFSKMSGNKFGGAYLGLESTQFKTHLLFIKFKY